MDLGSATGSTPALLVFVKRRHAISDAGVTGKTTRGSPELIAEELPRGKTMDTTAVRRIFLDFFKERGHEVLPSSSLIPLDPTLLLTTAGMVQFKPYLTGEEEPVFSRVASVQKCVRTTDIDIVGLTLRHLTFFEMLGNFSFGDYFKEKAIPWSWDLMTEGFGFDPERLWVTVYHEDDEAAEIWLDSVGVSPARLQRSGEDNFWSMGTSGPCGPSSEIFYDKGPAYGEAGGPLVDDERHVEVWNLVFMQSLRDEAGAIVGELPKKNIDTGAGLERLVAVRNDCKSIFEVDSLRDVLDVAESASGCVYGQDDRSDISLRILAEHGRSATFLLTDGVFPSNEARGYVLRRIIRRAVRHAWLLGVKDQVMTSLAQRTIDLLRGVYPELQRNAAVTLEILDNEESRFRYTLRRGLTSLDNEFATLQAGERLKGSAAFALHDTYGFPIELTKEIAAERKIQVDMDGFDAEMTRQREMATAAGGAKTETGGGAAASLLADLSSTLFLGYETTEADGQVVALLKDGEFLAQADASEGPVKIEVIVDRTPFYAESGGQVGDTGRIVAADTLFTVFDTQQVRSGLTAHQGELQAGRLAVGDPVTCSVDASRRAGICRHHTATHLLHWALRKVLGEHVRQQGSFVEPDRLRFDFSHYTGVTSQEMAEVEALANSEVLTNDPVCCVETSKAEADMRGVIAFFGDKYGETVRVLEAGSHSVELCGGTHVRSLGEIGPIVVVSESSIGSNIRRMEAFTGEAALSYLQTRRSLLHDAAGMLRTSDEEVPEILEKRLGEFASQRKELESVRSQLFADRAKHMVDDAFALSFFGAKALVSVCRGVSAPKELQQMAVELRGRLGSGAVVLGVNFGGKASLVSSVSKDLQKQGLGASDILQDAAKAVGGGTGRNSDTAMAGGRKGGEVGRALDLARTFLEDWRPETQVSK